MKAVAEVMVAADEQQAATAAQLEVEEGIEDRPTEMESMVEVTDAMEERRRMELEERKWRAEMELRERERESGERKWKAEMELRARELDLKNQRQKENRVPRRVWLVV